jgi:hypothetical protein
MLATSPDTARLTVRDDGCGIDAADLPHVFESFRQADATWVRPNPGLGLGLTIVRHLVEAHGGTIEASSRRARGPAAGARAAGGRGSDRGLRRRGDADRRFVRSAGHRHGHRDSEARWIRAASCGAAARSAAREHTGHRADGLCEGGGRDPVHAGFIAHLGKPLDTKRLVSISRPSSVEATAPRESPRRLPTVAQRSKTPSKKETPPVDVGCRTSYGTVIPHEKSRA